MQFIQPVVLLQAVSEDDFEKFKEQLHGAHAPSTLRFAENAEQQHMDIDNGIDLRNKSHLLASSSQALAGRLAPGHGQPSSLANPQPQVSPQYTPYSSNKKRNKMLSGDRNGSCEPLAKKQPNIKDHLC